MLRQHFIILVYIQSIKITAISKRMFFENQVFPQLGDTKQVNCFNKSSKEKVVFVCFTEVHSKFSGIYKIS